eukprot:scaffold85563_cov40-Cyclotella_meneghiniana.AAC.1
MSFFFLNKGCQHLRGAEYLSLGVLDPENAIGSTVEYGQISTADACFRQGSGKLDRYTEAAK